MLNNTVPYRIVVLCNGVGRNTTIEHGNVVHSLGKVSLTVFFSHSGVDFGYEGQKPLFKNVDFGIDMESRSKYPAFTKIHLSCRTMTNALQSNNSCTCICLCIG